MEQEEQTVTFIVVWLLLGVLGLIWVLVGSFIDTSIQHRPTPLDQTSAEGTIKDHDRLERPAA